MTRIAALVVLAGLSTALWGQTGNSTVSGIVKDATDAPIPAAKIKITNVDTGIAVDTVTNESGLYRAAALTPGSYKVDVDAPGFDRACRGLCRVATVSRPEDLRAGYSASRSSPARIAAISRAFVVP